MDFNLLEALFYGFVSGLTEVIPVSSKAHQALLIQLFNEDANVHLLDFLVHAGILVALFIVSGKQLAKSYQDYQRGRASRRRNRRSADVLSVRDFQLFKTILIPLILGMCLYGLGSSLTKPLYWVSGFFLLGGIILHIPIYIPHGNKDSRSMSRLDGVLIGLGSILSVLPGVSRVGMLLTVSVGRGAAPEQAFRWALMLSIPALAVLMGFDVYYMATVGMGSAGFPEIIQALLGGFAAFIGTMCAVSLMKLLSSKANYLNLSYYCWGAALFTFIICLFV